MMIHFLLLKQIHLNYDKYLITRIGMLQHIFCGQFKRIKKAKPYMPDLSDFIYISMSTFTFARSPPGC